MKLYQIGNEFFPEYRIQSIQVTDEKTSVQLVGEDSPRKTSDPLYVRQTIPNTTRQLEVVVVHNLGDQENTEIEYHPVLAWNVTYSLEDESVDWCSALPLLLDNQALTCVASVWGVVDRQTGIVMQPFHGDRFDSVTDFATWAEAAEKKARTARAHIKAVGDET